MKWFREVELRRAQPRMLYLCVPAGLCDRIGKKEELTNNLVHMPNRYTRILPFYQYTSCLVEETFSFDSTIEAAVTTAGTSQQGEMMMFPRAIGPSGG